MDEKLKAPFPYFGGKSRCADVVWQMLGTDIRNYTEPFAGSLAVLLARPDGWGGSETVNDWSCHLINLWRAIKNAPLELAELCVGPSSEVDLESQHFAVVASELPLRDKMGDPEFYDSRLAAFYVKGLNEWIGSGYGSGEGPWQWSREGGWQKRGNAGTGINRKLPHLGNAGTGINRQLPHLGTAGRGINRQLPHLGNAGRGEYERRIEFVAGWLNALRDRLCHVRMACGDWSRVLTPSTTTKHGLCGVFLDPPYDSTEYVYGKGTDSISEGVREWCAENGGNKLFRIVLAGRGDEHDALLAAGWRKHGWKALKGYSGSDNDGRYTEALWYSPHCQFNAGASDGLL